MFSRKTLATLFLTLSLATPLFASASLVDDLNAQIVSIQAQVAALQTKLAQIFSQLSVAQSQQAVTLQTNTSTTISANSCELLMTSPLKFNDVNAGVLVLQKVLNSSPDTQITATGEGSPGHETTRFGGLTYKALIKFQEKYAQEILVPGGLTKGSGFVGNATRLKLQSVCLSLSAKTTSSSSSSSGGGSVSGGSQVVVAQASVQSQTTTGGSVQGASTGGGNTQTQTTATTTSTTNKPAPTITFSTSLSSITTGQSAKLSWSSTDATSCSASNGWSGNKSTSGSQNISPTTATTYTLTCTGAGGSANKSVAVTIIASAPVTIPPVTTPSTSGLTWGAYVGGSVSDLTDFESLVGKPVNILATFSPWSDSFPSQYTSSVGAKGKTLLIFWEPSFGYDAIIDGSKDNYISQFAKDAKSYGYPVILVPFVEMNLNEEAWGYGINGNTAAKFITAWRHVHDLFASATNVKFAIGYNQESVPNVSGNKISDYYPGSSFVDYVGVDGFNFGSPWQTFGQVFDSAISTVSGYNKPIYLLSIASASGSQKAAWITEGLGTRVKTYPQIAGWIWFNENKEADWRVNSDSASLQAFKSILP